MVVTPKHADADADTDPAKKPVSVVAEAVMPTRSLIFFTLTATVPLIIVIVVLLFLKVSDTTLMFLSIIGGIVSVIGLGRLLYEMTFDIAGYPNYKLPIWSVLYLVVYLVSAFTFVFFALHSSAPGRYFIGLKNESQKAVFLDALYMSLCNYVGMSPDSSISVKHRTARFLGLTQSIVSMFINVVIITKFVNTF